MDYLDELENRTIYIIREAYARFKNIALLWSIGKDSTTLLWMVRKAFFGKIPFPIIHIDTSFKFKEIMNLYRPGMNPIRAIYYQTREVIRRFNPEHPYHYWLVDLVTDLEYNNIILDALAKDVRKLESIIKRYYFPMLEHGDGIPLELFHAKQQLKDFRHYYMFFRGLKNWTPDE